MTETPSKKAEDVPPEESCCSRDCCATCFFLSCFLAFSVVLSLIILLHIRPLFLRLQYADDPVANETWVARVSEAQSKNAVPLILFTVEAINLGETSRVLAQADHFKRKFGDSVGIAIAHFGGAGRYDFAQILESSSFGHPIYRVCPCWGSEKEVERVLHFDQISGLFESDLIDNERVMGRISEELELYATLGPSVVIGGAALSSRATTQIAAVPFVTVYPLFVPSLVESLPSWLPPTNFFVASGVRIARRLVSWFLHHVWVHTSSLTNAFITLGIRPSTWTSGDMLRGDLSLVSESPAVDPRRGVTQDELQSLMGSSYYFVGMLTADLAVGIPEDVQMRLDAVTDKTGCAVGKTVVFAMGSSGAPPVVWKILSVLSDALYSNDPLLSDVALIVAPVKHLLFPADDDFEGSILDELDDRIVITDLLNMRQLGRLGNVGIFHGGQGTVQTAVQAMIPFVGIPGAPPDQIGNIRKVESRGGAVLLPSSELMAKAGDDSEGQDGSRVFLTVLRQVLDEEDVMREALRTILEEEEGGGNGALDEIDRLVREHFHLDLLQDDGKMIQDTV